MPAEARGHVRKLASGKIQLRYYDVKGDASPEAFSLADGGAGRTTATWSSPSCTAGPSHAVT